MDYEKKYNEALERAKKVKHDIENIGCSMAPDMLEVIFPELRESEDERIRKWLLECIENLSDKYFVEVNRQDVFAYLEKQKEQKPVEKQDYSGLNDLERAILRGFLSAGVENVPVTIIKETAQECLAQMKSAEWSEDDEKMLKSITNDLFCGTDFNMELKFTASKKVNWLKDKLKSLCSQPNPTWSEEDEKMREKLINFLGSSLVPLTYKEFSDYCFWLNNLRPSWKPSEEQMKALNAMNCCGELSYQGQQQLLIDLYQQLKKLM